MTASRHVDARTDIWAIGVVLYELLTGRVPFSAETLPEICGLILTATPPAIRDYSPAVPDALQNVVRRCLEKDRERRFANVSELAHALSPFGSRATSRSVERIARILGATHVLDAMPQSGPAPVPANFGPSTQSNWGQTKPSRSSSVPLLAAAGVTVVLLGAVSAVLLFRSKAEVAPVLAGSNQPLSAEASSAVSAAPAAAPSPTSAASAAAPTASAALASAAPSPKPGPANPFKAALPVKPAAKPAAVVSPAPAVAPQPAPAPAKTKRSAEDLLSGRN
jgi:serine/threonine-protein kinase